MYHKFHIKRIENPKEALTVGQEVTVKVLDVNADAERVSLSIKALEERPAQEEGQKKKTCCSSTSSKTSRKRDLNFQKHKQDSQWLTCSVISNFNQIDNHKILCLKQGIFLFHFPILI